LKVSNCSDCNMYLLESVPYAAVQGCTNCLVVVGVNTKAISIEHCTGTRVFSCCRNISITCVTHRRPIVVVAVFAMRLHHHPCCCCYNYNYPNTLLSASFPF
jgi:hypothetical protein